MDFMGSFRIQMTTFTTLQSRIAQTSPVGMGMVNKWDLKKILLKKKKKHSAAEIGAMTLSSRRPEGLRSANFCGDRKFGGKKLRRGQRAKFQCVAL